MPPTVTSNRRPRSRFVALTALFLFSLVAVEILFTGLFTGRFANSMAIYPLEHAELYRLLWETNPGKTLELLLVEYPVLVVGNTDITGPTEVWSLYFKPVAILAHLGITLAISLAWSKNYLNVPGASRALLLTGGYLIIIAVSHLKLAACCGAGSRWIVDTILLSRLYDPQSFRSWGPVYEMLDGKLLPLQWLIAFTGVALMTLGWATARNRNEKCMHNNA